jgi:RimJ/RimL family protein N-acetyltransferase
MAQPEAVSLWRAGAEDSGFYRAVRNEPSVREQSFNTDEIDFNTHHAWFGRKLVDPDAFLFVITIPSGIVGDERVGYMRIQIEGAGGETSVAVLPAFRNHGYATFAIYEACARVFVERSDVTAMYAHIKPGNRASVRAFTKAGFRGEGLVDYEGHRCISMILKPNDLK